MQVYTLIIHLYKGLKYLNLILKYIFDYILTDMSLSFTVLKVLLLLLKLL